MKRIDVIRLGKRHRKDLGDVNGLARSIKDIGLLHPVVITPDNELIAGQRRLEACKLLGWQEIPVTVVDLDDTERGEYDENKVRKDFTPSEEVAIWQALESRQGQKQLRSNLDQSEQPKVRAAKITGTSPATLSKAKQVVEAAEAEPAKFEHLVSEMDRTGRVNGVYKKLKTAQQAEVIKGEPPPLPTGPFRVIVIDPPWEYDNRANDTSHRSANPYPSMSIDKIKLLPVEKLAEDDAILWLWTTNAHLPIAFDIVKAWGFEYKTMLTWVKDRMGTGDWLRGKTEHCLMAVRGKPLVVLTNQTTELRGPLREHSRKPDEFYKLVEVLCPGSKIELFARTAREDWISHGDQTELFLSD